MKHANTLLRGTALKYLGALLFVASTGAVQAHEDKPVYTMTTITDSAYGYEILDGNYQKAVDRILSSEPGAGEFFYNTNLCVAYTKLGKLEDADLACNAAVQAVDEINVAPGIGVSKSFEKRIRRRYLAVALSNRGVLRAALGDVERAREDFINALDTRTHTTVAKVNLARLGETDA